MNLKSAPGIITCLVSPLHRPRGCLFNERVMDLRIMGENTQKGRCVKTI